MFGGRSLIAASGKSATASSNVMWASTPSRSRPSSRRSASSFIARAYSQNRGPGGPPSAFLRGGGDSGRERGHRGGHAVRDALAAGRPRATEADRDRGRGLASLDGELRDAPRREAEGGTPDVDGRDDVAARVV